jgi:uncharacterized protein (DUF1778 family)
MTKVKKEVFLIARVTKADKKLIEDAAADQSVSISAIVRQMIELFSKQ